MTTKRPKKTTPEKEPIPEGWLTIRNTVKKLKSQDVKITYDGLSFYRKLGIIGKPKRFKGHMDKYFYYPDLLKFIQTAQDLTKTHDIKLKKLKRYIDKLPKETYFELPHLLLKIHQKAWDTPQTFTVPTHSTLHVGMRVALDNAIEGIDPKKIDIDKLIPLLEKETKKVKKDLTPDKR